MTSDGVREPIPMLTRAPGLIKPYINKRSLWRIAKGAIVLAPLLYFFPKMTLLFVACGLYDVSRNRNFNFALVEKYFFGNGVFTWLMSPVNTLMDILALPYINKGVYKLEDLPKPYQDELQQIIDAVHKEDLVRQLQEKAQAQPRSMFFFKWYGVNVDTSFDVPAFHTDYKYVKTIGVSVFMKKESTSKHFGPIRPTLRVLYNINTMTDNSAYIEVGDTVNFWRESKLFIFDDTLLHQSFNESDNARYCMFIDILRPSVMPPVFSGIVGAVRIVFKSFNSVFYDKWKVLKP